MGLQDVEQPHSSGVEAWYMDDSTEDQRLPHRLVPNKPVSARDLADLGVLQWHLDADKFENDPELEKIRKERNYTYQDIINVSPTSLPEYERKIKSFYEEHIHTDEEIRYCIDGSGYFDVRDSADRWIRIWTKKGDMIVLPAGLYHRFTLDESNYIKAMRLFIGEPVWTPYNRPQDDHPIRRDYINNFLKSHAGTVAAH
ncbi:1,2-dihydroxy-3-keto-5-methylthiopentene dioxygenase [Marchantia polymorpha subsp. ruderalis]|uniref:Acireductone dioxygenase n=2 Tax=Marchantia polymorpha TaxID=3197 RepID=A0AAF6BMG8_MARPO|nr:hypothetical protein MARPO_0052s0042 [Marchantia polymorpha]BBN13202.1 hypothetical protein Mp_6g01620 [Marchantia polymorpha subsp. ruderalis]|eukprot:PTQ38243.1 hypothetical protein MARPO_0052s0042 [Marchantia polymorpha]